jgi:endonuclease/exonuclease/phosphatase family metal-dependent hydrolase
MKKYMDSTGREQAFGEANINGIKVGIAAIHLVPGSDITVINQRKSVIDVIVNHFSGYDNVLIGGDFNIYNGTTGGELVAFISDGYILSNNGFFGDLDTCPGPTGTTSVDNIIMKGFSLSSVEVKKTITISDHYPIVSEIIQK